MEVLNLRRGLISIAMQQHYRARQVNVTLCNCPLSLFQFLISNCDFCYCFFYIFGTVHLFNFDFSFNHFHVTKVGYASPNRIIVSCYQYWNVKGRFLHSFFPVNIVCCGEPYFFAFKLNPSPVPYQIYPYRTVHFTEQDNCPFPSMPC